MEGDGGFMSVCHVLLGGGPVSPTFGVETWFFLESMPQKLEGVQVSFLS